MDKWNAFKLPEDMTGKSFLDIGCWEGDNCVAARRRGATHVVGLDLCTSGGLRDNVEQHDFEFLQVDIFSEKFLALGTYDVVLCSGVLYHVENVLSLLVRLRKVTSTSGLLVLETSTNNLLDDQPILLFHPGSDLGSNPSNWWTPNRKCLTSMLETCGFSGVEIVYEREVNERITRVCVHALATGQMDYEKILPRKASLMSVHGGDRPRSKVAELSAHSAGA